MRERSTHGECSKSSRTRRTVQSRAALGFVHKGSGVMGFLVTQLRISWNQSMISWERSLHTCVIISHSLFFTKLFKNPMKPPTLWFVWATKKQVRVPKHPLYRCLKIVIWKEIKHWPSVHLYLILLVAAQMFLRVSAQKVSILICKSTFV